MNIRKMNLNLLIALNALLIEKNVTAAGKRVFITQSAMSIALSQLREIFKDPLLIRDKKEMKLTVKALQLAPKIQQILHEIEEAIAPTNFDPLKSEYTFRIGMSDYTEFVVLPKILPLLEKKAPFVRLKIIHLNTLDKKEPLEEMQLDLAIGVAFDKIPDTLESEVLFTDSSACIADTNNPIMKTKLTLKKYLSAKHIVVLFPEEPYRSCIDQRLDQLGLKRNSIISVPHMIPAIFSLKNTPYLVTTTTIIAHQIAKPLKLSIKNLPFKTKIVNIKQAWLKQFNKSVPHQWLREFIKKSLQVM